MTSFGVDNPAPQSARETHVSACWSANSNKARCPPKDPLSSPANWRRFAAGYSQVVAATERTRKRLDGGSPPSPFPSRKSSRTSSSPIAWIVTENGGRKVDWICALEPACSRVARVDRASSPETPNPVWSIGRFSPTKCLRPRTCLATRPTSHEFACRTATSCETGSPPERYPLARPARKRTRS